MESLYLQMLQIGENYLCDLLRTLIWPAKRVKGTGFDRNGVYIYM